MFIWGDKVENEICNPVNRKTIRTKNTFLKLIKENVPFIYSDVVNNLIVGFCDFYQKCLQNMLWDFEGMQVFRWS